MAKKYENVENILKLLEDDSLGSVQKRLSSTEKNLSEILKKLSALEAEKAEREAAEAALRAEEEARIAAEEAKKAEAEKAAAKEKATEEKEPEAEEKPKKRTTKKKTAEEAEESTPTEEPVIEVKEEPKTEEKAEEPKVETAQEVKTEVKPVSKTFVPPKATPAAPRAPRYFRNGQVQGEYVAKPGAETSTTGSTYRPRPQGERPARVQGERTFTGARPAQGQGVRAPRVGGGAVSAPIMPARDTKSFSAPAKKKTYEKTYTEKKALSKRALVKQQGMTVEDFDEDKSGYRKVRSPKKQKQKEIQTVKIEHAVVTTQDIPLKVLSEKLGVSAVEISKRLFKEGIMKGINDSIDYENALMIAMDLGIDLEYKPEKTAEEVLMDTTTAED